MTLLQLPDDTQAHALARALAGIGLCIRWQDAKGVFHAERIDRRVAPGDDGGTCPTVERIRAARLGGGIQ